MKITGNEPAYPAELEVEVMSSELLERMDGTSHFELIPVKRKVSYVGLTIKQQIAKDFMVAMLTNPALLEAVTANEIKEEPFAHTVAKRSIQWANALIEELNQANE